MSKVVFIYPGQGSQKVGMGADIQARRPDLFAAFLRRCDEVVDVPVARYCLEGPAASLNQTSVAQPALFAHSMTLTAYAHELGLRADFIAGHSLGEYTAATAAGVLSFEDGLRLVMMRGKLSHEVQSERPGAMVAITGLTADALNELCMPIASTDVLVLANRNSHVQFVVSGTQDAIGKLVTNLNALPQKPLFARLAVGGAFHSPLMQPMQVMLSEVMETLTWHHPQVPIVSNVSGRLLTTKEEVHQALITQICASVYWTDCVQTLLAAGCDTFIELGSSNVLTKLVRSIANVLAPNTVSVTSADTLEKVEVLARQINTTYSTPQMVQ